VRVVLHGELRLQDRPAGAGETRRKILKALPSWFGIPASIQNYVAVADRSPTVIASLDSGEVGLLTLVRHSPYAAEVYVMGVLPDFHRQGIGQALLQYAEGMLAADGVEFLQVKTLGPNKPDAGYENTRAFYFSCGFRPLEEFPDLWDPDNPALQMIKIVPGSGVP
jgi:GNAT superfamily N-acetyltransferase